MLGKHSLSPLAVCPVCSRKDHTPELSGYAGLSHVRILGPNQLPSAYLPAEPTLQLIFCSLRGRDPQVPQEAWVGEWHSWPVCAHLCAPLALSIPSVWFLFRKGMIF